MSKESFEYNIDDLTQAIEICLNGNHIQPSLILLYAAIDIMAWLNRPVGQLDVDRKAFVLWVEKFLLPNSGVQCTALDLYAARCSVLHSYGSESALTRKQRARPLAYTWGQGKVEELQSMINQLKTYPARGIHVNQLFVAFQKGVRRFKLSLAKDPAKAQLVYDRADHFFSSVPMEEPLGRKQLLTGKRRRRKYGNSS